MSADAYHMTAPCPDGAGFVLSMKNALADAGIAIEAVDYINAHGTSTMADVIEAKPSKLLLVNMLTSWRSVQLNQ